jgi:hypothetical protein
LARQEELHAFQNHLSRAFAPVGPRGSASAFVDGLRSGIARKSGWNWLNQPSWSGPTSCNPARMQLVADRLHELVRAEVLGTLGIPIIYWWLMKRVS